MGLHYQRVLYPVLLGDLDQGVDAGVNGVMALRFSLDPDVYGDVQLEGGWKGHLWRGLRLPELLDSSRSWAVGEEGVGAGGE